MPSKPAALFRLSHGSFPSGAGPMGTMPLLELDDGTQLAESVAICRYIEVLHPDPPLFGTTPIERALFEMWNRRMEVEVLRPIIAHFRHSAATYYERLIQGVNRT